MKFLKKRKILYFLVGGEFGLSNTINIEIFKKLTKKLPEFHFVCISGKNPELYSMFEKTIKEKNINNIKDRDKKNNIIFKIEYIKKYPNITISSYTNQIQMFDGDIFKSININLN